MKPSGGGDNIYMQLFKVVGHELGMNMTTNTVEVWVDVLGLRSRLEEGEGGRQVIRQTCCVNGVFPFLHLRISCEQEFPYIFLYCAQAIR